MKFKVNTVALAALLCASTIAYGQDLGTPVITPPILEQSPNPSGLIVPPTAGPTQVQAPVAQPDAAPAAAPVAPPAAPPAAAATAEPQVSRAMTSEQFDDWTMECFEPSFDGLACQATLRVIAGDNSQVVMVMALSGTSTGPVSVQMALPLGIAIEAGVQLIVGQGYQNKVPVARCTPAGCLVEGTATSELVAALRRERSGIIVVESETAEKIRLPFSLTGFTRAFEAVVERNGKAG